MNILLRLVLIIAGLIFAASLLVVMCLLMLVWAVRALWLKLTGQPVSPFAMRMNPRAGFDQVVRQAGQNRSGSDKPQRHKLEDVTDVEPKS